MSVSTKIVLITLIIPASIFCQNQSSFNSNTIHWSAWGYHNSGLHNQLGFRTVMDRAVPEIIPINPIPPPNPLPNARINLQELSGYDHIFAVNNNATSEGRGFFTNIPMDWLYFLTGGYYNVFYASGAANPTNQYVVLKQGEEWNDNFGKTVTINGKTYLTSGRNIDDINKILLRGPNYYQHKTYELNDQNLQRWINYRIQFEIKPGQPVIAEGSSPNLPMVACSVLYKVHVEDPQPEDRVYTLASDVKTFNELTALNNLIEFGYTYQNYKGKPYAVAPANDPTPYGTEFVIKWLGNYEILAHKIELWDMAVWSNNRIDNGGFNLYKRNVSFYINKFKSNHPQFHNKLRGWLSLNEPHTVDLLRPFRFVDSLCKYEFNTKPMFTQWYPNWNNNIDGTDFLKQIMTVAQPNPLFYWYYPFDSGATDLSGMYNLHSYILERTGTLMDDPEVNKYYPSRDFYYTAQAWGYWDNAMQSWRRWRQPSGPALRGSIFMALAYGCKGVFVEPLLSYLSDETCPTCTTMGLTKYPLPAVNELNTLGEYVRDNISPRITEKLGPKLAKVQLTEMGANRLVLYKNMSTAWLRPGVPAPTDVTAASNNELTITDIEQGMDPVFFLATILSRKQENTYYDNYYKVICLTNLITDEVFQQQKWIRVKVKNRTGTNNAILRNIETGDEVVFADEHIFDEITERGDGRFYELSSVIHLGGPLTNSDTLNSPMALTEKELVVKAGSKLVINTLYESEKNIIVEWGGEVVVNSAGTLKFNKGSRLQLGGKLTINGGMIDFTGDSVRAITGIICSPGSEIITEGGSINNAQYGIASTGSGKIKLNGTSFNNCGTGISVIDFGGEFPEITNCTISGGSTGITLIGGIKALISSNTITTTGGTGIDLNLIDKAYIKRNDINETTSGGSYCGIYSNLSGGRYSENRITGFGTGIFLIESSPYLFGNRITGSLNQGIYIGGGSNPQLSAVQLGDEYLNYSFGGNNTIINNGEGENDEEVYLSDEAKPEFEGGYNNITDLRSGDTELMESAEQIWINLSGNYLGENWKSRIINLNADGSDLLTTPADYEYTASFMEITEDGKAIDTVYEVNQITGSLSGEEALFAIGEGYYQEGENAEAIPYYRQIVYRWQRAELAILSASRLIAIYMETETNIDSLTALENYLGYREQQSGDEREKIALRYLQSQCQTYRGEYVMAEDKINQTVQNNWGNERGYFAGINLELVAMLGISENRALNGGTGMPQGIKKEKELREKRNNLLKTKYGMGKGMETKTIAPAAVEVYDNYPNPFGGENNKITRIKFGLPYRAMTELLVYDILGRKVGEILPRGNRDAGYYEAEFNATGYASGVYFYRLKIGEKQIIKKMIIAK